MRTIFLAALLLPLALSGQVQDFSKFPNLVQAPQYMVHFTTYDRCPQCNFRTAMVCMNGDPDCNVPTVTNDHYEVFAAKQDAMKFIADGFVRTRVGLLIDHSSDVRPSKPRLVAVYELKALKVEAKSQIIEVPQPSRNEERITYTVDGVVITNDPPPGTAWGRVAVPGAAPIRVLVPAK